MTKTQRTLLLTSLVIATVFGYVVADRSRLFASDPDGHGSSPLAVDLAGDDVGVEHVAGLARTARDSLETRVADPLPPPVDLDRVDRTRDLHGVVVRTDKTPVAAATLQAVYYPWRYGGLLTDGQHGVERIGATTESARDGTFSLRLRPGDQVHLRVAAKGLATTELAMLQAGQRVHIVLHEPVRLIVHASTPAGKPAAGLALRLFRRGRGAVYFDRSGTTGEDGRFIFEDLPPRAPAYLDPRPRHEGWGDPGWIRLQLPAAGELTHEFTLPGGRTLRGTVTDAGTGEPIEGARVGMNWVLVPETRTDAEGRYVLHSWSGKGVSDIHVLAAGYSRAQVDVEAREVLDFELVPGFSARGRLLDANMKPIEGAQVTAGGSERGGRNERLSMAHALSDEGGRFLLTGLSRDMEHVLTIVARGHAQGLGDIGAQLEADEVDLGDIVLGPARVLVGTLHSADQELLSRVLVSLRIEEPGKSGYRRGRTWERRTDDLGRFRFEDLLPGQYTLTVRPEGGGAFSQRVDVLDRVEPTVIVLVQEVLREVRIRVTDEDGKPLPSMNLRAHGSGLQPAQAQTDEHGIATLRLPPVPATVRVGFSRDRPFVQPAPLQLRADQGEGVFVLERAAITKGTLLGPTGKPVAWAALDIEQGGRRLTAVWTDVDGRFKIPSKAGAVYSILFRGVVAPSQSELRLAAQRPMEGLREDVRAGSLAVVIRAKLLAVDGSIRVRVLDPDGNPIQGIHVNLTPFLPGMSTLRTDAEGRLQFEGLLARRTGVSLFFRATSEQPWFAPRQAMVMPEGQVIVLQMRRGARIEGTLWEKDGTPAQGGVVFLTRHGSAISTSQVDRDGHFVAVVDPLETGPYGLRGSGRAADGSSFSVTREGVRAGETGIVLRPR